MTSIKTEAYASNFNEKSFFSKVISNAKKLGYMLVYKAYLLYYTMIASTTPWGAKTLIAGALAYLVLPVDFIPDFLPGGFVDDAGAIATVLKTVDIYITEDILHKANIKTKHIFGMS